MSFCVECVIPIVVFFQVLDMVLVFYNYFIASESHSDNLHFYYGSLKTRTGPENRTGSAQAEETRPLPSFEVILYLQRSFSESLTLFCDFQCGFRKARSTGYIVLYGSMV